MNLSMRYLVSVAGFYVLVFTFLLPGLSFLWLSETVYQARLQSKTLGQPLVVVGFNEPSLYFRNGTDVKVVTSSAEALTIAEEQKGLALVAFQEGDQDQEFGPLFNFKRMQFRDGHALDSLLKSLNYSRNKWRTYLLINKGIVW